MKNGKLLHDFSTKNGALHHLKSLNFNLLSNFIKIVVKNLLANQQLKMALLACKQQ